MATEGRMNLYKQQVAIVKDMERLGEGRNLRSAVRKQKMERLETLWQELKDNHLLLEQAGCFTEIYFKEDHFSSYEECYRKCKEALEKIEEEKDEVLLPPEEKEISTETTINVEEEKLMKKVAEIAYWKTQFNKDMAKLRQLIDSPLEIKNKMQLEAHKAIILEKKDRIIKVYDQLREKFDVRDELLDEDYEIIQEEIAATLDDIAEKWGQISQATRTQPLQLEAIKIPKFYGDIKEWSSFHDLYKKLIHEDKRITDVEKMYRLKSLICGDASRLIHHLQINSNSYEAAWEILCQRYENKRQLFTKLVDRILDQPSGNSSYANSIRNLLDTTLECVQALKAMGLRLEDADPILARIVIRKLDNEGLRLYEQTVKKAKEIQKLKDVTEFLEQQYNALEATNGRKSFTAQKSAMVTTTMQQCLHCKASGHHIIKCSKFMELQPKERNDLIKNYKICRRCLKHNITRRCDSKVVCEKCRGFHNTILHMEFRKDKNVSMMINSTGKTLLATAQIRVKRGQGEYETMRALIDQGSQTTVISEEAAQILNLPRKRVNVEVHGLGGMLVGVAKHQVKLEIHPRFVSSDKLEANAIVMPSIASCHPDQSFDYNVSAWKNYTLADPDFNRSSRIDVVIGSDLYVDLLKEGVIKKEKILGQATKLGWILSGNLKIRRKDTSVSANITQLDKFWELEEVNNHENPHEDEVCMQHYTATSKKSNEGRFVVKLPFRENTELGDSYKRAMARVMSLEKRFKANDLLRVEYTKFMDEYIKLGHMKKVEQRRSGKYYIPHQAVIREESLTTKLRVVFDASMKTSNSKSLNDIMYVGPRLQKDVFDIIINFRMHKYVMVADIEKMYRQIVVDESDQSYQHILWRSDKNTPVEEYKLTTVTYGTSSAPFLAVRTLLEMATECNDENIARRIRDNFYMDDLMTGTDSIEGCIEIQEKLRNHLKRYGFHLRKWCSNATETLKGITSYDNNEVIKIEEDESIKTLGLQWSPKSDNFLFNVATMSAAATTKRLSLSYLARIFDPLGLLTPITVTAKLFIQKLWVMNLEWDVKMNDELANQWRKIVQNITVLQEIRIPRWVKTTSSEKVYLIGFADASEKAYAAVVYAKSGKEVSIVAAKSKVNPIKNRKTIPKLELCAAQLLARLVGKIMKLVHNEIEIHAWSDSMITLAWIQSNTSKDKFVRTRVTEIRELIPCTNWRYVRSADNPADIGSRGIAPEKLKEAFLWWRGPTWLEGEVEDWPTFEIVNTVTITTTVNNDNFINDMVIRYSSWTKLVRILAYVIRFTKKLRKIERPEYLGADELEEAEKHIIRSSQVMEFAEEIGRLKQGEHVCQKSRLAPLNPFLDKDGILRVRGRLQNAEMPFNQRHPAIMANNHLSDLIIGEAHKRTLHGGNRLVECVIRRNYWIIGMKNRIRKLIRSCVKCTRYRTETHNQLMGNLPGCRVNASHPFEHCGVDYAGPIQVKVSNGRGYKSHKGYVAVFVCMATKAIHLEAVSELSSEAFLAALRRFFARRGKCRHMYSDNGTNFVGAAKKIDKDFKAAIEEKSNIVGILAEEKVEWHFIPPGSPHFGGLWEAGVKSMKHHLRRVIGENKLTFEELSTVLAQIESVLNSRPLFTIGDDANEEVLTPGHFLIGRSLMETPEPAEEMNISSLNRWRLLNSLRRHFWKKWKDEYLTTLQNRYKWCQTKPNMRKGQVVLVKNEDTHPARWPMGKIVEVHPGSDGLVRVVSIQTQNGVVKRPIRRVCPLDVTQDPGQVAEGAEKNNMTKKFTPSGGSVMSKVMVIMLALLVGQAVAVHNTTKTSIETLPEGTAVYMDNLGRMDVTTSTWNMVVYYNLSSFLGSLEQMSELTNQSWSICGRLGEFKQQCHKQHG